MIPDSELLASAIEDLRTLDSMTRAALLNDGYKILQRLVPSVGSLCAADGRSAGIESDLRQCEELLQKFAREEPGRSSCPELSRCQEILARLVRQQSREQAALTKDGATNLFDRMVWLVPSLVVAAAGCMYLFSALAVSYNDIQVYWRADGEKFSEPASQHLCATMDGQWSSYEFRLAGGEVEGLRIDPVGNGPLASVVRIRHLQFKGTPAGPWEEIPLAAGDCDGCKVRFFQDYAEFTPVGEDPWLELSPFVPREISVLKFEASIDAARLWPWAWLGAWFSEVETNCDAGLAPRVLSK